MTCRPGAEGALKHELAQTESAWRPSYSRAGFLTFKVPGSRGIEPRRLAERQWMFAHTQGVSHGHVTGAQLMQLAQTVWGLEGVRALASAAPITDVHVWEPAAIAGVEATAGVGPTPLCGIIEESLRAAAPDDCQHLRQAVPKRRRPAPRAGVVLDVVVISPSEWWIGSHLAVTWPQRWPGGVMPVAPTSHFVSRAYLKLNEALQWSGLPLAADDECVEIGCAPGGAAQALLERGLFVTGIDPADVDPDVLAQPRFRHLKKRARDVRRHEFKGVRWLIVDMNIAPADTLDDVEAIVTHPGVALRGLILTLKLPDWNVADQIPEFIARVRAWGYRDVRVRQLVTGRQEVCLAALRRKALRRLGPQPHRGRRRRTSKGDLLRRDAPHSAPSGPHF